MGVRRTSGEFHVSTQIVGAALAVQASPARAGRFDSDGRARLEAMYGGADGVHGAGGLVAHGQGLVSRDVVAVDAAMVPEVHVATTHADVGNADYDAGGIGWLDERGDRMVFDFGGPRPV